MFISAVAASRVLAVPVTSYANSGGTGARSGVITGTTNVTWNFSTGPAQIIDGDFTQNTTHSIDSNIGSVAAGGYIRFDFLAGVKKYIDEVKITSSIAVTNGSWKLRGSNDASAWTDLATFTWNQAVQTVALTGVDILGYRYYDWICPAGNAMSNAWIEEIEFKIAPGAT